MQMRHKLLILTASLLCSHQALGATQNFHCSINGSTYYDALQINADAKQARFGAWPFTIYTENQKALGWSSNRDERNSLDIASFILNKESLNLKVMILSSAVDPSSEGVSLWQCVQPLK